MLEELGWKCKGTCIAIRKALQGLSTSLLGLAWIDLDWIGLDALQMRGVGYL